MSVNFMQVLPGGICFAHGPYEEMTCPKWPACITDPTNAQYYEMGMKKALEDPRDFAIQKLRTEIAALSAEVTGLRKDYAELECLARLREDDHDRMQEKLREDKERMDWMEGRCAEMIQIGDEGGNLIYRITPGGHGEEVPDYEARTLRAAIDAARQEKKDA